jgi:hypothetical protein
MLDEVLVALRHLDHFFYPILFYCFQLEGCIIYAVQIDYMSVNL